LDWAILKEVTTSEAATALSKDLKRRGWSFVGPTTIYSMMESIGLVNDHLSDCAFRDEVERARASFQRPLAGD
jgi:DNA-3-methyladenine glycosylase I